MSSPNETIEPRILKGFRDLLPADLATRNALIGRISSVMQLYGFSQIETPALEYADILNGKLGDEGEKLLYQFTDHGNRQVAMRYDFTVPLARVMAMHPELPQPFKRFQVGPVWRADNTQRGRYREFYQFDFDSVGGRSDLADAEIIAVMHHILTKLNVKNFTIRVNHRHFLEGIANDASLTTEERKVFYTGLDKWDKIGGEHGVKKYWMDCGISEHQSGMLSHAIQDQQGLSSHPANEIIQSALSMGVSPECIKLDPTIVRGLDYYTGIVFETTLNDAIEYGSVLSGGRYDGLIGRFTKNNIPAVGASIGLDRLIAALGALGQLDQNTSRIQAFITIFNDELESKSIELVKLLRDQGKSSELYMGQPTSLGKQLRIANARSAEYAVIIGPDEASSRTAIVKRLDDGKEVTTPFDKVPEAIR